MKRTFKKLMGMVTVATMSTMLVSGVAQADAEYTIKLANSNAPFTNIDGHLITGAFLFIELFR